MKAFIILYNTILYYLKRDYLTSRVYSAYPEITRTISQTGDLASGVRMLDLGIWSLGISQVHWVRMLDPGIWSLGFLLDLGSAR